MGGKDNGMTKDETSSKLFLIIFFIHFQSPARKTPKKETKGEKNEQKKQMVREN